MSVLGSIPASAPWGVGSTAFVGRSVEVERLDAAWAAALDDRRQAIFIGGEPGVGKTRLVAEMAAALRAQGASVLWGACRADLDIPYRPFVAVVEEILDHAAPDALREIPPKLAAPLVRLTDSAVRRWPELGDSLSGSGDSRPALFDAVLRLVMAVADRRPTVLVLEDLHWAAEPTLAMLAHLVESTAGERLLILATRRTTAPDRNDAVTYALADLGRLDGVGRIDLDGLSVEEVAAYLVREGRVPSGDALATAPVIRHLTGGNPFFLQEYWRDLQKRGGLGAVRSSTDHTPQSVRDSLALRMAAFDPELARVVEFAAVVGDCVDIAVLLTVCDLDAEAVLAGIDFGTRAGLLISAHGDGEVRFAHALARQAVLDQMSATARARAHAQVAAVLESQRGERDPSVVADLAHHYFQARVLGHEGKAVHFLVMAARHAERSLAHREAAELYERAAQLHTPNGPTRAQLMTSAARCRMHGGDFATARRIYEEIAEDESPRVRLLAAIGHEDASWRPSEDGRRSLDLLDEALHAAALDHHDPLYVRARASMGRAYSFTGDARRARVIGEDALLRARAIGDERLIAHALTTTLWQSLAPDRASELLARAHELQEIGARLGDDDLLGPAAFHRGELAYIVGDEPAWSSAQRDLTERALARGQPFFRYVAGCSRYAHRYASGDFDGAWRIVDWLDEQFRDEFGGGTEGPWGLQQFMLRRVTSGLESVRAQITGAERPESHWPPALLALYTELGMSQSAARMLTRLCERIDEQRGGAQWAGLLAFAAEAAVKLDDRSAAAQLRPLLAEYSGANLMAGANAAVFGSADRYLGELDSLLGRSSADQHFERALAMDRRMGAVTHQAETLAAWSRHRRRTRDGAAGPSAAGLAGEARALAQRIGHHRVLRELDAEPLPDIVPPPLPHGLTSRELGVLRLVAEGLSNREIGDRLFISPNTAANHIRSILDKLDAPNRTRAARIAADHGLL